MYLCYLIKHDLNERLLPNYTHTHTHIHKHSNLNPNTRVSCVYYY